MRIARQLIPIAGVAILLAAAGPAPAGSKPLARVDGQPLSGDDLVRSFATRHSGHTGFLGGEVETRRALDHLVDQTLLMQEAERLELGERPEIRGELESFAARLAVEELITIEVNEPSQPTDEEIRAAYDRFTDHLLKVRQIVVPTRADADEILASLAEGVAFEDLAAERSTGRSAQAGGLVPPIGWGTMSAAWDEAVFALEPGETSAPIETENGWEVVRVEERLSVDRPEFSRAAGQINAILSKRKLAAAERRFVDGLLAKYEAEIELLPYDPALYRDALERDPATVVARWSDGELLVGELAGVVDFRDTSDLSASRAAAGLETAVRSTIAAHLAGREALARGYDELPDIADRVRQQREAAMLAMLHEEFIFRDVEVSDDDVRAWYEDHTDALRRAERRLVAQILTATQDEALAVRVRLDDGEDFAALVQEASIASDAAAEGVLGWVEQKDSPPGFEVVFALGEGEVSAPIESEYGWHLIRVLAIQPGWVPPLEDVAAEVRVKALRDEQQRARREWLVQLRESAKIKYYASAIRRFAEERAPDREAPVPDHGSQ